MVGFQGLHRKGSSLRFSPTSVASMCRSMKVNTFWKEADESVLKHVEVGEIQKVFRFEEMRTLGRWLVRNSG